MKGKNLLLMSALLAASSSVDHLPPMKKKKDRIEFSPKHLAELETLHGKAKKKRVKELKEIYLKGKNDG